MLSICLSLCLRPLHQVAPIWVGAFEQRNFQIFSAKFTKYANGIPFFAGRCCVWLVSFPILCRSNKKLLWRKPSAEIWQQRKSIYAIAAFYDAAAKLAKFKCNFLLKIYLPCQPLFWAIFNVMAFCMEKERNWKGNLTSIHAIIREIKAQQHYGRDAPVHPAMRSSQNRSLWN